MKPIPGRDQEFAGTYPEEGHETLRHSPMVIIVIAKSHVGQTCGDGELNSRHDLAGPGAECCKPENAVAVLGDQGFVEAAWLGERQVRRTAVTGIL